MPPDIPRNIQWYIFGSNAASKDAPICLLHIPSVYHETNNDTYLVAKLPRFVCYLHHQSTTYNGIYLVAKLPWFVCYIYPKSTTYNRPDNQWHIFGSKAAQICLLLIPSVHYIEWYIFGSKAALICLLHISSVYHMQQAWHTVVHIW